MRPIDLICKVKSCGSSHGAPKGFANCDQVQPAHFQLETYLSTTPSN
jgi:hypothetical protein